MKVRIKFFAILRERVGKQEVTKDIQEGSSVGALWESLKEEYPKLAGTKLYLLYAVNQSYVKPDHILNDDDEVVFVPPVSGG